MEYPGGHYLVFKPVRGADPQEFENAANDFAKKMTATARHIKWTPIQRGDPFVFCTEAPVDTAFVTAVQRFLVAEWDTTVIDTINVGTRSDVSPQRVEGLRLLSVFADTTERYSVDDTEADAMASRVWSDVKVHEAKYHVAKTYCREKERSVINAAFLARHWVSKHLSSVHEIKDANEGVDDIVLSGITGLCSGVGAYFIDHELSRQNRTEDMHALIRLLTDTNTRTTKALLVHLIRARAGTKGADFDGADLRGLKARSACFDDASLRLADLSDTHLRGLDAQRANFEGANFTGAFLKAVFFQGANLAGCNFTGANLTGCNLTGANLAGANLTGANLTDANLAGANLDGCDLTGTKLTGIKKDDDTVGLRVFDK